MVFRGDRKHREDALHDEHGELFVDFEQRRGERIARSDVFRGVFRGEEGGNGGPEGAENVEVGEVVAEDLEGSGEDVDGLHGERMIVGLRHAVDGLVHDGIRGLGRRGPA